MKNEKVFSLFGVSCVPQSTRTVIILLHSSSIVYKERNMSKHTNICTRWRRQQTTAFTHTSASNAFLHVNVRIEARKNDYDALWYIENDMHIRHFVLRTKWERRIKITSSFSFFFGLFATNFAVVERWCSRARIEKETRTDRYKTNEKAEPKPKLSICKFSKRNIYDSINLLRKLAMNKWRKRKTKYSTFCDGNSRQRIESSTQAKFLIVVPMWKQLSTLLVVGSTKWIPNEKKEKSMCDYHSWVVVDSTRHMSQNWISIEIAHGKQQFLLVSN